MGTTNVPQIPTDALTQRLPNPKIASVSENLLTDQTGVLEKYQWFVRSHLADWAGGMANAGADSVMGAARAVAAKNSQRLHLTKN